MRVGHTGLRKCVAMYNCMHPYWWATVISVLLERVDSSNYVFACGCDAADSALSHHSRRQPRYLLPHCVLRRGFD